LVQVANDSQGASLQIREIWTKGFTCNLAKIKDFLTNKVLFKREIQKGQTKCTKTLLKLTFLNTFL